MNESGQKSMGPLTGLRVVDIGTLFAGPLVASTLGDMGADVIKIEHPSGDEVRKVGRYKNGESLWWRVAGRNKRTIALNAGTKAGAEIVHRLAAQADVMIENFRPGRMQAWGLGYDSLSRSNPELVMLHMSGYGQTGPYKDRPGMGTLAEAFSGFAVATGETGGPPTLPQFPLADGVAAMAGTYAVLAALWARERNGGGGEEIDINLFEPLLALMGSMVIDYDQLGHIAMRRGNRSTWSVPRNAYRTRDDRWIAVSGAANSIAKRMFLAIDRPDLANDPTLATNPMRVKRLEECDGAIAAWIARHTQDEALQRFRQFEVTAGPVSDVAQLFEDPHVIARGTLIEIEDERLGPVRVQNTVPRFSRNPASVRWLGRPQVGQDTHDILTELGYTEDEIERLQAEQVARP